MLDFSHSPAVLLPERNAKSAAEATRFVVVEARTPEVLLDHLRPWDELAINALEPNVFFESWFFWHAWRLFNRQNLLIALVYRHQEAAAKLCGIFPFEVSQSYHGLPFRVLRSWHHLFSGLQAPLLCRDSAAPAWSAFMEWARNADHGCGLLELPFFPADGPLHGVLDQECTRANRPRFIHEQHQRAVLRPRTDAAEYLSCALNNKRRQELRRQERRLADLGPLEFRVLDHAENPASWIDGFLQLERSGWKGQAGTAFACRPDYTAFFRAVLNEAYRRGQLDMLGLFIGGRPAAMKCNFRSGDAGFAFKIAYDEALGKYSPGVHLELFNIKRLHSNSTMAWMDSCAVADHLMINRLWLDRRTLQNIVLATGRPGSAAVVSSLPMLRWLKQKIRPILADDPQDSQEPIL